jgi:hypothetical protein
MSRATPAQTNFNGGEISRRLHGRVDLSIYDISVVDMTGYIPLIEGGAEACPGFIWVEQAAGDCRLLPFEYNVTQGHVIEASAFKFRFFTNDGRIEIAGNPVEVATPYSLSQVRALDYAQSFDVLYLFHGAVAPRQLVRTGANSFVLETVEFKNGPFEPRNEVETLTVGASGVSGDVTLESSGDLFAPGDVGGLFQMEAGDFGSISSWEPGITVTYGQLLTWLERVYRVVGGGARTGTVEPLHTEGVEWDGIGKGTDLNNSAAGGVQLEYVHDRFGILKITAYTSATEVSATVLRRLPFTAITGGSTGWEGGYWDPEWGEYVPPEGGVSYAYGTWRWRFGAFSTRRGFPQCGCIWNERLWLAKGSMLYASVAGDFTDHATYNENGDITASEAIIAPLKDANAVLQLIPDDRLLAITKAALHSIGPSSAAAPVGPGAIRTRRENRSGCAAVKAAEVDEQIVYLGKSRKRIYQAEYDGTRDRQAATDLTRYARHIGKSRFVELTATKDPERLLWGVRENGTLAAAAYVPEEQVLGWAQRPLGAGLSAKSCAAISDPAGELDQLWIAASYSGATHILRLAQFRDDAEYDPTGVMLDMAAVYDGAPESQFNIPVLAGKQVEAVGDGIWYPGLAIAANGDVDLPAEVRRAVIGLPYPARLQTLPLEAGGDGGPAMAKMQRVSRISVLVAAARGLRISAAGGRAQDVEQLKGNSITDAPFDPDEGIVAIERTSDWGRRVPVLIERVAPFQGTILAVQPEVETSPR